MAIEKWTVLFDVRDAGNERPVTGWKEKELKVQKIGATNTTLEKNKPALLAEAGKFATCEIQKCKFVTVEAESAEEACLVVDRFLSQNPPATPGALTETAGAGGPSLKGAFVNVNGKAMACLTSNVTEVAVV